MSGYVKLHSSILDSTIWYNRPDRELFLTALLLARPIVTDEPLDQLEIDRIEPTGWQVPPGRYGFCEAASPGLINRAGVGQKEGLEALRRLSQPEDDSRSQEHDGRRIARINGGFLILNFAKYRNADPTAADRARKYRKSLSELDTPETREVFDHWRVTMQKDARSTLTKERARKIIDRLKRYSVEQIKGAITGAAQDDWIMGRSENSPKKYNDLVTILRDDTQVERFLDKSNGAEKPRDWAAEMEARGR